MSQVLRYHVVGCQQLLLDNLKVTTSATTLQGEPVSISVSQVRAAPSGGSWSLFSRHLASLA